MHIKIYDKHEPTQQDELHMNYLVLGVHSFTNFLHNIANKRHVKVLLIGKMSKILENVLWNEYFSYTLLRDMEKIIFGDAENGNTFLKIGCRTYRLADCLDWSGYKKIQMEIAKCRTLCIEGFMADSSIRFVTIQIRQTLASGHDLVFQYLPNEGSKSYSFSSQSNSREVYSTQPKSKPKNNHMRSTIAVKSLFQQNSKKNRNEASIKYSTQNKNKSKVQKSSIFSKKEDKNSHKRSPSFKNVDKQNQTSVFSLKTASNYVTGSTNPIFYQEQNRKQQITANILHKKQQKIKEYRINLQEKQKQFAQKISQMELKHQQQASAIKKQVQQILATYKKKNKTLRKQNECLNDMNKKLTVANTKLQQKIASMAQDIHNLKQNQQNLQKTNIEYSLKLSNIQKTNLILVDQINKQEGALKSQIMEKDRTMLEIKNKYDRLLGTIKNATEMDKQNRV